MQCRACLQPTCESTVQFDDLKIMFFNLITNLSVTKDDNMPQQLCQTCTKELGICVEFRQKCINSNAVLLRAQTKDENVKVVSQLKQENVDEDLDQDVPENTYIEIDTKHEIQVQDEYVEGNAGLDNFVYEFVPDVKKQEATEILPQVSMSKGKTRKRSSKVKDVLKKKLERKVLHRPEKFLGLVLDCGLCTEKVEADKLCSHVTGHEHDAACGVCALPFPREALLQHRVTHLQPPHLVCHVCLLTKKTRTSLETHYKTHVIGGMECNDCGKRFRLALNLEKHIRAMHDTTTLHCDQCTQVFSSAHDRRIHEKKVHRNKCSLCEFVAETRSGLRQHLLRLHADAAVTCETCRAVFVSASALGAHACRDRAAFHAATVCNVCGKLFHKADKLKEHLTTHTGERKYKCEQCGAAYRTWRAMRAHRDRHDGLRPHACEFCPATFTARPTLVKHRRVHTGERPYVCKMCGKGFTANHNLKQHMRVHGVYDLIKKKPKDTKESSVKNNSETSQN